MFALPPRFDKGMGSNALLAASAPFTVQDKCVLEAEEACYVLGIESAMPIFAVRGGGTGWGNWLGEAELHPDV